MSRQRFSVLFALAFLTLFFISGAVIVFFDISYQRGELSDTTLPISSSQALRLTVEETGIAKIPLGQLRDEGLSIQPLATRSLLLSRDGQPVPFYIAGEGEEATLYFFAEAITRSVEAPAVYWLTPGPGLTIPQRNQSPKGNGEAVGLREWYWEENSNFHSTSTGDDAWFGENMFAPGNMTIPLGGLRPTGGAGRLTVRVWSSNQWPANPDHHMEVWLNDVRLTNHFWDGKRQETLVLPVEAGILRPDRNTIVLNVPGDTGVAGESIFMDWIRLEYVGQLMLAGEQLMFQSDAPTIRINGATEETLVFDVTAPSAPVLITNTSFRDGALHFGGGDPDHVYVALNPEQAIRPDISAAPLWQPSLRAEDRGADYIAIVPDAAGFDIALAPLLEHRRAQGLRVVTVPLQQIYDEFAHGRPTPQAIRDFLNYTRTAWEPPAPRFVLLAGDASYDVNDYLNGKNRNLVPTYLLHTDMAGYIASDTWFTITNENMPFPELAIGRLPAQTGEQLKIMVDKILTYEQQPRTEWPLRALLVADDEARFNTASDWLGQLLSENGYRTQKLYMTRNEDIHDAIISALNHGVGLVNYAGHGNIRVWGDEMVFQAEDTQLLMNKDRLPVFTTFTCLNGFFSHPNENALAEELLWTENGGIVAAVAPSSRTYAGQQGPLAESFYEALLDGSSATLGEALLQAKVAAARDPNLREAVHTFNLLGDPALNFHVPGEGYR